MAEVVPGKEAKGMWEEVLFIFDEGKWVIKGTLKTPLDAVKVILSALPIKTEAIVLNEAEVLIKLDSAAKVRISGVAKRLHHAEPGMIIYRPQVPAISIFADYMDIYEPVEEIGTITREHLNALVNLAVNAKHLLYVEIRPAKSKR